MDEYMASINRLDYHPDSNYTKLYNNLILAFSEMSKPIYMTLTSTILKYKVQRKTVDA